MGGAPTKLISCWAHTTIGKCGRHSGEEMSVGLHAAHLCFGCEYRDNRTERGDREQNLKVKIDSIIKFGVLQTFNTSVSL